MTVTIGWASFDALSPPTSVQVGFAEFDARAGATDVTVGWAEFDAGMAVAPEVPMYDLGAMPIYGGGGVQPRYHSMNLRKQYRIRVRAENEEEEQIVLNLIMEFARHVI